MQKLIGVLTVFMLALLSMLGALGASAQDEGVVVITNGVIIDGTGAEPLEGQALVIVGERIAGIYETALYDPPPDAQFIDAEGGTILPGFINAHTHFTEEFTDRRDNHLAHGVTSVCNLDTALEAMPAFDMLRDGDLLGARGFIAGPMVAVEGGYPGIAWGEEAAYNVVGPDEAAAAVNVLAENGANYIKISLEPGPGDWPVLTLEEVQAVTEAAHANDLEVIAHIENADYLEQALDGGVDMVTHIPHRQGSGAPFSGTIDAPEIDAELDALITRMVEDGVRLIPTLHVITDSLSIDSLRSAGMIEFVRRFHERGGVVVVGNDYPIEPTGPGIPLPEMQLLSLAGLSNMEIIVAGTASAAAACGQGEELGTLEEGKLADVVIVAGDPLADLNALEDVSLVLLGGEIAFDYR
ncbi:MAG: amidohydrolase family protein [Burkholderiales bacterium]|nr:amidohydrolase family protein [Anaerolineae bacterium]